MLDREALREEALRIHLRYSVEVVEAFGFCPWASAARTSDRVRTRVVFGEALDLAAPPRSAGAEPLIAATLHEMHMLERDDGADIGLLVFPELHLSRLSFQHFAARVRAEYEPPSARRPEGFALADFHPDATPELGAPELLVPFIRRTPDPTLQLIRHSALRAAQRDAPGTRFMDSSVLGALERGAPLPAREEALSARLARANLEAVQRAGVEQVRAVLDSILCDRVESYGRLGLAPPPWSARVGSASKM